MKVYEVVLAVSAIRVVGLFSYVNKPTTRVSATRTIQVAGKKPLLAERRRLLVTFQNVSIMWESGCGSHL